MSNLAEFNISEDHFILFQSLNIKNDAFTNNLAIRIHKPININISFVDNDKAVLLNNDTEIAKCDWEFLAIYSKLETKPGKEEENKDENVVNVPEINMKYNWTWSYGILPDDRNAKLKESLMKDPEFIQELSKNVLQFADPMVISYLFAFIVENMNLSYVYISKDENDNFSAFGLKNISWIIDPIPELVTLAEQSKKDKLAEEEKSLNDAEELDLKELQEDMELALEEKLKSELKLDDSKTEDNIEYDSDGSAYYNENPLFD